MTDKKRRQRGSRTHGGGSHKNRRGAGNRGGRGAAGRDKHEQQLYGPLGKHGFTRPEDAQEDVETISVREVDEDIQLHVAEGLAQASDDGIVVDARDLVEDGHEVDVVKVLGGGQVTHSLVITADDFSETAREMVADAGGECHLSERGEARAADEETESDSNESTDS